MHRHMHPSSARRNSTAAASHVESAVAVGIRGIVAASLCMLGGCCLCCCSMSLRHRVGGTAGTTAVGVRGSRAVAACESSVTLGQTVAAAVAAGACAHSSSCRQDILHHR